MTEKLYYNEPYLKEWEAQVLDILEKDDKYFILLDRTAFYPEGGGQPSDKGFIDDIEILEVIEEGKEVYHIAASKPEQKYVKCKLNFERRFYHMQQHTGQHLLSAMFFDKYKGETSSFHLGDDYVSIDISISDMSDNIVKDVENIINGLIYKNLKVKTYLVDKENLNKLPLRKFPKVDEDIRIVEIDNIDYSPCCGTHVNNIGELGIIKILKTEKYKGVTRVYFKCGRKAFEDFQSKHEIITNAARILAVDLDNLLNKVENTADELNNKLKEIRELKENLYIYEAKDIIKMNNSNAIVLNFEERNFDEVQNLGRVLLQQGGYLVILSSEVDRKLWLAHNGNYDVHCGKVFKETLQRYNGRGGGGEKQAQAAFSDRESLLEFIEFLKMNFNI